MSFDGLMMHHLTNEYKHALSGHRVDKIMYLKDDVFIFELYFQKERNLFYIDMHANDNRLYYTLYKEIKHDEHPTLSMLKKTLIRSQIKDIKQYQTDRVCIITFEKYDAFDGMITYELIVEMMGKHANMILTKDQKILEAYKKMVSETGRSIAYHLPFIYFPSHKKQLTSFEDSDINRDDLLATYEGMSKDLSLKVFTNKIKPFDISLNPSMKGNKRLSYEVEGGKIFPTINEMMLTNHQTVFSDALLMQLIKKRETKLPKLIEDLSYHQSHLNDYLIAEKLYAYENPKAYVDHVEDIILNHELSVHEHAQKYLLSYNKAKRAIPHLEKQIQETHAEIDFLNQLIFDLNEHNMVYDDVLSLLYEHHYISKKPILKKVKLKKHLETMVDGHTIFIGKNANINAYVTHELSRPNDFFMHVKDAPGSHVLCRGPKESKAFQAALKYAAYFSTLKFASKIEVMVALKKDVKKIPGMHGSMVSVKNYHSYMVELDDEFVKLCESL
jgi:predicted ribosome quality control (RQC) complex YloA/Tae2 family protein